MCGVETHVPEHKHETVDGCIFLECLAPLTSASSFLTLISLLIQNASKGVDSQTEGEGSRPSMDLFKAIFASSSDEKSSSSEDEQGDSEEDQAGHREADFSGSQETDTVEASSVSCGVSLRSIWGSKEENEDV